jgi:hypothetical protein
MKIKQGSLTAIVWIGVLLFALLTKCNQCGKNVAITKGSDSTLYWKNKAGDAVVSQRQTEEEFSRINKKLLDSIAKVYKVKTKNVKEVVLIYQESKSDVPVAPGSQSADYFPPVDNCPPLVKNMRDSFANQWYKAAVQIGDSSYLHLSVKDSLAIVWKTVKTGGLFKRKEFLQVDISNTNPDVRLSGVQTYRTAPKAQKRFAIGVQAGYGFSNSLSPAAYVGIGVSYSLIRF